MLDRLLKKTAVLGAAGKMGSGIALLLLQEMARLELANTGRVGSGDYCLILIDSDEKGLFELRKNLRSHMLKYAEKNINLIRQGYKNDPSLISNEEMIKAFIEGASDLVRLDTHAAAVQPAHLVFEAIVENLKVKSDLFKSLKNPHQYYFTNTSSIPISLINLTCSLDNKIIGFHFYNPPAVQKLLEMIAPQECDPYLVDIALELAQRLHKTVIPSNDIAGFIGNGHLMREVVYACELAQKLSEELDITLTDAIFLINAITQNLLLRPMGIFQLIDYVGIDVCQNILRIMHDHLPDTRLKSSLIDSMIQKGITGGQHLGGAQKAGFFRYENNRIKEVYGRKDGNYIPVDELQANALLIFRPAFFWKQLTADKDKKSKLDTHFKKLQGAESKDAKIAQAYLAESKKIALNLVKEGVARRIEDVDAVLENGFFHLYGASR